MLGLFGEPKQAAPAIEIELPKWLHDVDLLIVDFDCLVSRFPVREIAMRADLRDFFQRTYWRRFDFEPVGASIRLIRDTLGWTPYRQALELVERWELRSVVDAEPDRLAWRTLYDFWMEDGLTAVVGDYTQRAMLRTIKLFETDFLVDMIVGVDDVQRPKPDPAMLVSIGRATQIPAERRLYVGNGRTDMATALHAEVDFLDYRRTFGELSPELRPDQLLLQQLAIA